ncbi:MAG: hypothetical protein HYZ29_25805 [Myxococcales bacterium]|nr:hypothetical protein [Myxococcales bacterium]
MRWVLLVLGLAGCSGGGGGDGGGSTPSFGGKKLASLTEPCQGITGLTGQAVLDQKTEKVEATLGYVTASGSKVSPTALTLDLIWPGSAAATCYPPYEEGAAVAGPRVGIAGLEMRFVTADGKFDETLEATAWLTTVSGAPGPAMVVGVTTRSALNGTWEPFPDYGQAGSTLSFANRLTGATSAQASGNVSMTAAPPAEIAAGVFRSGFAMAIWPTAP